MGRMMRRKAAEKIEIINLVEQSSLSIKKTLKEFDVPRGSFYRWYLKYQNEGWMVLLVKLETTSKSGLKFQIKYGQKWLKRHWKNPLYLVGCLGGILSIKSTITSLNRAHIKF